MGHSAQETTHGSVKIPCSAHALKPYDFAFRPRQVLLIFEDDLLPLFFADLLRIVKTTCPTKRGLLNYTKFSCKQQGKMNRQVCHYVINQAIAAGGSTILGDPVLSDPFLVEKSWDDGT